MNESHGKLETNDRYGGILVSEQQQSSGKLNGVAMSWTKDRKQEEERKKENMQSKKPNYAKGHRLLVTTP